MHYELWRRDSLNLQGSYATLAEVRAALRQAIDCHGSQGLEGAALARVTRRGKYSTIAEGERLVALAQVQRKAPRARRVRRAAA